MSEFLAHLHSFPDIAILAMVVGVLAGIAMAAPHVGLRLFRLAPNKPRTDAVLDAFKAIMAMTGVVLAFALVQANANLKMAEGLVAKQAATISSTDRILLWSGNPQLAVLRPELETYARSIVNVEWPLLASGDRDDGTDDLYNALSRQARAVSPEDARQQAMFAELLKQLDDMADLPEQRIVEAEAELPTVFWAVAAGWMGLGLALQLRIIIEVRSLCGSLVGASPT